MHIILMSATFHLTLRYTYHQGTNLRMNSGLVLKVLDMPV